MPIFTFKLICLLLFAFALSACDQTHDALASDTANTAAVTQYPLFDWTELKPADWDEMALLKNNDLNAMEDDDPKALALLEDVSEIWNNAPVNQHLNGKAMTMHGYIAPLDYDGMHVKTFLLVPYFGACIHSPPPPSNQVVYVSVAGKGIPLDGWDAFVEVSGTLAVVHTDSMLGTAGYQMKADIVKPLTEAVD